MPRDDHQAFANRVRDAMGQFPAKTERGEALVTTDQMFNDNKLLNSREKVNAGYGTKMTSNTTVRDFYI